MNILRKLIILSTAALGLSTARAQAPTNVQKTTGTNVITAPVVIGTPSATITTGGILSLQGGTLSLSGGTVTGSAGIIPIALVSGASTGTVVSITSGNLTPLFDVTVTNPTTAPTLTFSALTQSANLVYAGPASGGSATPSFRTLVAGDIPSLSGTYFTLAGPNTATGSNTFSGANTFSGTITMSALTPSTFLILDSSGRITTTSSPGSGTVTSVTFSPGTTGLTGTFTNPTSTPSMTLSGVLNAANGGTGTSSLPSSLLVGNGSGAVSGTTSLPFSYLTGSASVTQGGTGTTGFTANTLVGGNGTSPLQSVSLGGGLSLTGNVLNVVVPKIYDVILNYNGSGCGMTTTTGSLTLSNSGVTVSSSWTWITGEGITIVGAGTGGKDLVSTVTGSVSGAIVTVTNCSTISNSTTLTVSSATSLTTGMSIVAPGIWPGTTIGAISGTAITLTNSFAPVLATASATITGTLTAVFTGAGTLTISGTAATSVSSAIVRHNDLAAINAAVAAATFDQSVGMTVGGNVFLSAFESLDGSGVYEVEGSWNATTDSLITVPAYPTVLLPPTDLSNGVQISFKGEKRGVLELFDHYIIGGVAIDATHQLSYTTSTPTGTNFWPAVISPGRYFAGGATFSSTDVFVDNLLIQLPANPPFGGISLAGSLKGATGDKVAIWAQTPTAGSDVWTQPTNTYSFGIAFPQDANEVQNVCGQDEVVGVFYAYVLGEHVRLDRPVSFYDQYCLFIPATAGAHTIVGSADSENTAFGFFNAGGCPVDIDLGFEINFAIGTQWYAQQPGGGAGNTNTSSWGIIRYSINNQGTLQGNNGWGTPLDVNGCQPMAFVNLNSSVNKPTTPMLQYNFGNTTDTSGNQNLTNVGTTTFTTASGLSGATHAAIFNGTSQYLTGTTSFGIVPWSVFGGQRYTFTGWFNTTTTSTQVIFGQLDNSNVHGGYELYLTSSKLSWFVSPTFTPSLLGPTASVTTTTTSTGSWHFYCAQLDSQLNTITLSIDNGTPISTTFSGSVVCPMVPMTFANNFSYPLTVQTNWFKGMQSNFRMYDYIASAAQINDIYNGGNGTEVAAMPVQLATTPTVAPYALSSGAATITNSAITKASNVSLQITTPSGTITTETYSLGTGTMSVAGAATDNSTGNAIIFP